MSVASVAAQPRSGRPGRPALLVVPEQPVAAPRFLGRGTELEALDCLLRNALGGRSGGLVVRGEAGIGKSSLLGYAARSAAGFRVAHLCGVEAEKELSFAALQQLCGPAEGRIAQLPGPQADALEVAFGLRRGPAADPFLVGLAVLSLLSALAEEEPVLWIVDDAQWLDQASAQVLGFVARRLQVDPVALLFAERTGAAGLALAGLPALEVTGLSDGDARALLAESLPGPLDAQVAERILAEAHGNPLALLELPRASTTADLGGGFEIPGSGLVPDRIEDSFRLRIAALPEGTRLLLLAAAAEPLGDPGLLRAAASRLGLDEQAKGEAEAEGLIRIGDRVAFRHPLVRSAVYHGAPGEDRRLVHRALAEVTDPQADPDRRAWHRAQAADGADEEIAADLEHSAERAHARGGLAAEAAFRERAVSLTPDRGRRAARALTAAAAKLAAGAPGQADKLMQIARQGPLRQADRAHLELLEARALLLTQSQDGVPERLLHAARELAPFEPALSRETYLQAIKEAMHAGRLGFEDGLRNVVQAARSAPPAPQPPRPVDLLLDGLVTRFTTGGAAGILALQRAFAAFRDQADSPVPAVALFSALRMWDDETWGLLVERTAGVDRRSGNLVGVLNVCNELVARETLCGRFDVAARVSEEAAGIRAAIGAAPEPMAKVILAGWRGREQETLAVTRSARPVLVAYGSGQGLTVLDYATALQYNALGRYDVALDAVRECADARVAAIAPWVLAEVIEAAARTASPLVAAEAIELLTASAAGGSEWGLGVLARCRALVTSDARQAEDLYTEAVSRLGRTSIATDLARAHLVYGEWLRRQRRRGDAREQLRTAYGMFAKMGAEAFTARVGRELRATGEHPRKRSPGTTSQLTPQQAQISQLASAGLSTREIAAQLFVSPRTVEYHLQNIFTKLDITSRAQLPHAGH
jgi:DNA-binding CsgD family transcriptional regulator